MKKLLNDEWVDKHQAVIMHVNEEERVVQVQKVTHTVRGKVFTVVTMSDISD